MRDKKYNKKIRKMIFARVVILPVSLLLLVSAVIVFYFVSYSGKEVENSLLRIASDHGNMIDSFLMEKSGLLRLIVSSKTYDELKNENNLNSLFSGLQAQSRAFIDLGVFDEKGNHVAYAGPYNLRGKNYHGADWFKMVEKNGSYISDEFLGYRKSPHFVIAVKRIENTRPWYLRATIDTIFFNNLVDSIRIGRTGTAYIVNREGVLKAMNFQERNPVFKNGIKKRWTRRNPEPVSFFSGGLAGVKYIYSAVPLTETEWTLVVRQETFDAYFPLFMAALVSLLIIIGGGTIVIATGFIMASNMANRLKIADAEKREMKTQLIIAGKLAEVGEMSTGIAHEINNPLQIIKSEITMIDDITEDIEDFICDKEAIETLKDSSSQIKIQVNRCSSITRGLLSFARKNEGNFEKFKINELIPEIVHMVDEKARVENIKIIQEIDKYIPEMISDKGQIQQVFLNLLNNSIYALQNRPSPVIRIIAKEEKNELQILVSDNGCGFKKEEMEKAFLPFFTTKPVGQGTGLGLSTVFGIVRGLGGNMSLKSEYMEGAEFHITLPFDSVKTKKDKY